MNQAQLCWHLTIHSTMSILVLVRHGQSVYNLENRFTGNLDIGLTPLGEEEARQAGAKLKEYPFDMAFSSMLIRAQESLRIILEVTGQTEIPVIENAALNERMYGSLQGLNKDETCKKYGVEQIEIWRRSYDICPPDGESLAKTFERTIPYYKAQIEPKLRAVKNVLIVAHGNSLSALMKYLENISPEDIVKVNIPTGMPRMYTLDVDLKVLKVADL